eukprot:1188586-Prorocentrum_minimum.AAC.2
MPRKGRSHAGGSSGSQSHAGGGGYPRGGSQSHADGGGYPRGGSQSHAGGGGYPRGGSQSPARGRISSGREPIASEGEGVYLVARLQIRPLCEVHDGEILRTQNTARAGGRISGYIICVTDASYNGGATARRVSRTAGSTRPLRSDGRAHPLP